MIERTKRLEYLRGLVGRPAEIVRDRLSTLTRNERAELERALTRLMRFEGHPRERADDVKAIYGVFYRDRTRR